MSKVERLFVGNLPAGSTEQELRNEFCSYGSVKTVEVKTKKDPVTDEVISTFAFISIEINDQSLKQCLREFREEKYRGRYLMVSVARESFLDKLKREREEAANISQNDNNLLSGEILNEISIKKEKIELPVIASKLNESESSSESEDDEEDDKNRNSLIESILQKTNRKRTKSSSSSSGSESESESDDSGVFKKKSKAFLQNGKIKIESGNVKVEPIHIIEKIPKKQEKIFDEKGKVADQKRVDSLNKMKDAYKQKQLAIKNALTGNEKVNKIIFNDEGTAIPFSETTKKSKNADLFNDDEASDNEDFTENFNRVDYEGKRGAKLQQMNLKYSGDRRFQMNSEFLDEEDQKQMAEEPVNKERQWQYGILENIVGHSLNGGPASGKESNQYKNQMLRFDPTQREHSKYLTKNKKDATSKETFDGKKELKNKKPQSVSKEQFYVVSDRLKSSIASSGNFSFSNMFGQTNDIKTVSTPETINLKDSFKAVLNESQNQNQIKNNFNNPFKYDSSEDDNNDDDNDTVVNDNHSATSKQLKSTIEKKSTKNINHSQETFFFLPTDERLQEALAFFTESPKCQAVNDADAEFQRHEMRTIIKKKMKRAVQSKLPFGAKPNRKFRRFARNL